ncbi:MAG: hypothetical protein QJR13_03925 [Bacillota bacterium]|nr:hypothetical protein [Bacillota bacterium]
MRGLNLLPPEYLAAQKRTEQVHRVVLWLAVALFCLATLHAWQEVQRERYARQAAVLAQTAAKYRILHARWQEMKGRLEELQQRLARAGEGKEDVLTREESLLRRLYLEQRGVRLVEVVAPPGQDLLVRGIAPGFAQGGDFLHWLAGLPEVEGVLAVQAEELGGGAGVKFELKVKLKGGGDEAGGRAAPH